MTIPSIDNELSDHSAIRTRIWIQGLFFTRDPRDIEVAPKRVEALTQTSDLGRRADRAFVKEGWASILEKHEISMTWPDIREPALLEHLNKIVSLGMPWHFGIWKPVHEVFAGDGVRKDFYLQRRLLLGYVTPETTWPHYPTRVLVYDHPFSNANSPFGGEPAPTVVDVTTIVHKTSSNIDTGTPSAGTVWIEDDGHIEGDRWLTRLRFGTAPPDAPDVVSVQYLPLYRGLIEQENARSYKEVLAEPRGFKIVEA